jgi:hypothetical protein
MVGPLGEHVMKEIDASNGVFALNGLESQGFRSFLALQGIQCVPFPGLTAGWVADHPGNVRSADDERWKLMHAEDMEKVKRFYRGWAAKQQGAEVYYAGVSALGHPHGKRHAGLIQIVDAPGSNHQIGVATQNGQGTYWINMTGHARKLEGEWILDDGLFVKQ